MDNDVKRCAIEWVTAKCHFIYWQANHWRPEKISFHVKSCLCLYNAYILYRHCMFVLWIYLCKENKDVKEPNSDHPFHKSCVSVQLYYHRSHWDSQTMFVSVVFQWVHPHVSTLPQTTTCLQINSHVLCYLSLN